MGQPQISIQRGMKELWLQFRTGEKRRMLPLHEFVQHQGVSLDKNVIKAHILTGDDYMSKMGLKHAALKCDPVRYLSNFAENESLSEQDLVLAEGYLVKVWAGVKSKTTFNDLRVQSYTNSSTTKGIDALPPTSSVVHEHISRAYFLVRMCINLLEDNRNDSVNPLDYGWEEHSGALLPSKCIN